jgi:hypothetical protein
MGGIRPTLNARRAPYSSIHARDVAVAAGVGLVSFVVTEFMHHLLVPDLGRRWERLLAEAVSAVVVAALTAKLIQVEKQKQETALLRWQVISEMNHHVRNALSAITLSTDAIQNQQCIRVISESVNRIEWTLREILLRPKPVAEKERERLGYVPRLFDQENKK